MANKLFNVCLLCAVGFVSVCVGAAQIYIWLEFNGPWLLLLHDHYGNQAFLKIFSRVKCPFFFFLSSIWNVSRKAKWGRELVCINLFLLRGPSQAGNEYMGHWVPAHNGHSWCGCHRDTPLQRAGMVTYGPNLPSRWTPNKVDCIDRQNPALAIYPCLLISW